MTAGGSIAAKASRRCRSADRKAALGKRSATLADYPATTPTNHRDLKPGQQFSLRLSDPVRAVAVRIVGKPACGDSPRQAFSSCAELEAFAR